MFVGSPFGRSILLLNILLVQQHHGIIYPISTVKCVNAEPLMMLWSRDSNMDNEHGMVFQCNHICSIIHNQIITKRKVMAASSDTNINHILTNKSKKHCHKGNITQTTRSYFFTLTSSVETSHVEISDTNEMMVFRPLLCTLLRLNWAKQTPGIMRRN